jgi:hypothetical protein
MRREDAVNLMTKHVLDMNRGLGEQQGIPEQQIVNTLEQMKPELDRVNEQLFDVLYEAGIINLHG